MNEERYNISAVPVLKRFFCRLLRFKKKEYKYNLKKVAVTAARS